MNIWLLATIFPISIISGLRNFSALKKMKTKNTFMYHIFAAMCFIAPAAGFSYLFLNLTPSLTNIFISVLAAGIIMALPNCLMQFYYRKNN